MLKLRAHVKLTVSCSLFLSSTTAFIGDISVEYSCKLISADYRLTQSAEMIFRAVHHVEAESTCQADSVSVIVLSSCIQQYSIHWGHQCLV